MNGNLAYTSFEAYSAEIKKYMLSTINSKGTTTHMYENMAPIPIRTNIILLSDAIQLFLEKDGYKIHRVPEMNELYSSVSRGTGSDAGSDAVFETEHIDGPFGFIPGCYLYRCILTIVNDTKTQTVIKDSVFEMKPLEFVVIDYNRDLHYISSAKDSGNRFVIKLHFAKTPSWLSFPFVVLFIKANVFYNIIARKLFLYAINPTNWCQKSVNFIIMNTTRFFSYLYSKKKQD